MGTTPQLRLRCACGWETTGPADDVVAATQDHGRRLHNMTASREEVLATASPADSATPPAELADGPAGRG